MKPVSDKINNFPKDKGCTPISAACIKWEGPDIPCINLCKGDTIDKVVYDLAKILCEITDELLDVSTLDFGCLVQDGACEPKTLLETLQALINKACEELDLETQEGYTEPFVQLPACLHFQNDENDTVTQLLLSEYAAYLADKICEILLSIASIDAAITNLNSQISEIWAILDGLSSQGVPTINVGTNCLSGDGGGGLLPIEIAFGNLESALCLYQQILGDANQWAFIGSTCIQSDTALPCDIDGATTFGELPNWIQNPTNAAQSVNNLWTALCAVVSCVGDVVSPAELCSPVPIPANMLTLTVGSTQSFLYWSPPALGAGYTTPTSYIITFYDEGTTNIVDTTTKNYTGNPTEQLSILHGGVYSSGHFAGGSNAGKAFDIEVVTVYNCDGQDTLSDPITIYNQVVCEAVCDATFEIDTDYNPAPISVECPPSSGLFVQDVYTSIRIQFYNTSGGGAAAPAAYSLAGPGLNTEFNLRVQHQVCAGAPPSTPTIFEELFTLTFDGSLPAQPLTPIPGGQGLIGWDMTAGWVEYRYRKVKREVCSVPAPPLPACDTLNSGINLISQPGLYGVCLEPVTLPTPGGTNTICKGASFDTEINDC